MVEQAMWRYMLVVMEVQLWVKLEMFVQGGILNVVADALVSVV